MTRVRFLWLFVLVAAAQAQTAVPGVGNFHAVTDRIYRGAQPKGTGFEQLRHLGVKTVLDLRSGADLQEKRLVESLGMRYEHVPLGRLSGPSDEQIAKAIAVLDDHAAGPLFVHCWRGSDRTGMVVACYRMARQSWSMAEALAEARKYGLSVFQPAMRRYIQRYHPATETKIEPPIAGAQP